MERDTIHLELDADENLAVSQAILYYHTFLVSQPETQERNETRRALVSVSRKALAQVAHLRQEQLN